MGKWNGRAIGAWFCLCFSSVTIGAGKVDADLASALSQRDNPVSAIIHLNSQYDLALLPKHFKNRAARIGYLTDRLRAFTDQTSATVRGQLYASGVDNIEVTALWLTNSLRVKAPAWVIESLAEVHAVKRLSLNAEKAIDQMGNGGASIIAPIINLPAVETSWGVEKVGAPEAWKINNAQGEPIDGRGVRVAVIDSGVNITHPDLMNQVFQNTGEMGLDAYGNDKASNHLDDDGNGFVDDVNGWNFENNNNNVQDSIGHGSKSAGIILGNGANGILTGVAPRATVIPIKACCGAIETAVFESRIWEALQYALITKADVISMSISVKDFASPSYEQWRRVGEVFLKADVVHVNSAGNSVSSNVPKNIGAPGSNPPAWLHPEQVERGGLTSMISVGATDETDQHRPYSAEGPTTWQGMASFADYVYDGAAKFGLIKPEICAPSEVPSTSQFGAAYTKSFGGTSSAAPNAAGVAALLLSAFPDLSVSEVTESLMMGARTLDPTNPLDNRCGAGRVDAVGAIEHAKAHFR